MISAPQSARRAEAGFVLVAVLWILAALATLATIYSSYAVDTAVGSHVADDRVQAEASIRAGVEMAVFRQLALPERARPFRGAFDIRVGRTGVAVRFRSETARIDLNAAPTDLLAGLFTAVGVDPSHAQTFADRIVGWRTKTPGSAGAKGDAAAQGSADAAKTAAQAGAGSADTARQASAGAANATAQTGEGAADTKPRRAPPPRRTSFTANSTCLIRRATPRSKTRWSSVFFRGSRSRWSSAFCHS